MDLESSPDNLDDGVLDHQLRRALQVDPSPEFLTRVRARVAEQTPAGRWYGWSLRTSAAVAMAGVIVLAAVTVHRQTPAAPVVVENPSATPARATLAPPRSTPPEAIAVLPGSAVRARPLRRGPLTANARDARRTRSSDEGRAIRVLLDGVRAGDPTVMALLAGVSSLASVSEPVQDLRVAPISVPPVTIEPLPPTH